MVSFAATFEACVFLCGHRLLFVRGFLCCLLLGSLASWVKIGDWFWALIRFLSCVNTGARHFWFHLRQGLTFVSFFPFLLPTFSSLLVVFAVLCIAFALCRKFFGVFWTQITWSSGNWRFYANCRFFLAISVFLPLIASLL